MERPAEERPEWAATLKHVGVYYEGLVDDAELIIEHCKLESVTTINLVADNFNIFDYVSIVNPVPVHPLENS